MTRVDYTERQRLRAEDLSGEQDYLLGLAGRHYVGPHKWGIVRGLFVTVENNKAIVSPGLAIDGYGRELIVRENIERPLLEDVPEQFVYLFYCERAEGGCGAGPNARWRDEAEVVIHKTSFPEGETNLFVARAAGRICDGPPWPVLLGFVNADKQVVLSEVHFTRVVAARVASPSRRTIMRIGQENLADRYHFRVSAQDAQGALRDRLAINLDGNTSIWGNLNLEGSTLEGIFKTSNRQFIKIESQSADAGDLIWRVTPSIEGGERILRVTFRKKGELTPAIEQRFRIDNERSVQTTLSNFNQRNHPIKLAKRSAAAPVEGEEGDSGADQMCDGVLNRELTLERAGGVLKFDAEVDQTARVFCRCDENNEREAELPRGLMFQPVATAPTVPTSRDIYSIAVKRDDQTTTEELRISGGVFAEGDFKQRVTFGGSEDAGAFTPWLTVKGNGNVELPGGQITDEGVAFEMICVTGTTSYPPVKPDPRDPLFNDLLVLAFTKGVEVFSASLLEISFSQIPAMIELGKRWQYELQLKNLSLLSHLKMKTSTETLTTSSSTFFNNFLNLEVLKINETVKKTIAHSTADFPAGGSELVINVAAQMEADGDPVGGSATSKEIPIYTPPSINEDSIPDSVLVGFGVPLSFALSITNGPSEQVTITDIQVDGLGATSQHPTPTIPALAPGQTTSTTDVTIPVQQAGAPNLEVTVLLSYTWREPNIPSSVSVTKTIVVITPL